MICESLRAPTSIFATRVWMVMSCHQNIKEGAIKIADKLNCPDP
jgi:hypothetical protein